MGQDRTLVVCGGRTHKGRNGSLPAVSNGR